MYLVKDNLGNAWIVDTTTDNHAKQCVIDALNREFIETISRYNNGPSESDFKKHQEQIKSLHIEDLRSRVIGMFITKKLKLSHT